jgi:hypothetical protein
VKEFFQDLLFALEELDVIEQQNIYSSVLSFEAIDSLMPQ